MQETQGAKEQWKLRGDTSARLRFLGACVKMLWKAEGFCTSRLALQRSSWRCVRVSTEQRPRQGFRPPCNCGGSPSKGQDQSLWPGNASVCPVLSLLTRELHSEEGLLHSGAGELGNSFSPNQGPSRALQGELRKHSTRRTVWNLDVL